MSNSADFEKLKQAYGRGDERIVLEGPIHVLPVAPGSSFGRTLHWLKGRKTQWMNDGGDAKPYRILLTDNQIILTELRGLGGVGPRPVPVTPVNLAINVVQLAAKTYQTARAGTPKGVRAIGLHEVSIIESWKELDRKGRARGWIILQTPPDEKGKQRLLFYGDSGDGSLDTAGILVGTIETMKTQDPSAGSSQAPATDAQKTGASSAASGTMSHAFCTHCGAGIGPDDSFCHTCGKSLQGRHV